MDTEAHARLDAIERRYRRLVRGAWTAGLLFVVLAATGLTADQEPGVIRATELVIEDPEGVVRARLGGDLPDAEFEGRTVDRGSAVAGLLLYDKGGAERSGYVTFDESNNVVLTLDAGAAGGNRQTAFFVADEDGATALRIWNAAGDHVELRADSEDGAWFNVVEDGVLTSQIPGIEDPSATGMCTDLHGYVDRVETEQLMAACRQRMTEEDCRLCLEPAGR